jgi:hypothetical protein
MTSRVQLIAKVVGITKIWVNLALATHMTTVRHHKIYFDKENKL